MKPLTLLSLTLAALVIGMMHYPAPSPAGEKPDVGRVVRGDNDFAFDLYHQLAAKEGNQFFSPYSISTALAMTYAGARGQTADEMAKTLHFALPQDKLSAAFGALLRQTKGGKKEGYQLDVANALWGQKDYGFLPDFLNLTRRDYGAGLREVDFARDTEGARQTINRWALGQTHDKIKELIRRGILTVNTRLVLTNAIYFKGAWEHPFPKDGTRNEPFRVTADDAVPVPMMHVTERLRYAADEDFQALELPYGDGSASMLVLLPKAADGLPALEKKLSAAWLDGVLGRLGSRKVIVSLPKFRVTREYGLNDALARMGMPTAFQPGKADFSGMVGSAEKVWISAVIHKAYADVNEEGTEAAAATAVVIEGRGRVQETTFRADHPFVFLIRDHRSGSVLFLGRVANPRA